MGREASFYSARCWRFKSRWVNELTPEAVFLQAVARWLSVSLKSSLFGGAVINVV